MYSHKHIYLFLTFVILSMSLVPLKIVFAGSLELPESSVVDDSFNIDGILDNAADDVVSSDSLKLTEFPDFFHSGFNGISSFGSSGGGVGREDVLSSPQRFVSSVIESMVIDFLKSEIKKQNPYASERQIQDYFKSFLLYSDIELSAIGEMAESVYFTLSDSSRKKILKAQEWVLEKYGDYKSFKMSLNDLMDMGFDEIFDIILSEFPISLVFTTDPSQWGLVNSDNDLSYLFDNNYYSGFIPIGFNKFISGWNDEDILESADISYFLFHEYALAPYIAQYGGAYVLWVSDRELSNRHSSADVFSMVFISSEPFTYDVGGVFDGRCFELHDPLAFRYPSITFSGSFDTYFYGDYGPQFDDHRNIYYKVLGNRFYFLPYNAWTSWSYSDISLRSFSAYIYADSNKPVDMNFDSNNVTFQEVINYYNDNSVNVTNYGDINYNDNSTNIYITVNFPEGFFKSDDNDDNSDALNDLIDSLKDDFNNLQENIVDAINENSKIIGGKIDNLGDSLETINQNTKSINTKVDDIENIVNEINSDTGDILFQIGNLIESLKTLILSLAGTNERLEAVIIMLILILGLAFIVFILWLCIQLWRLIWSHMIQVWF